MWSGRGDTDLYLAARSIAGTMKVSFHATGQRHAGFTSQYAARETNLARNTKSRHIEKWHGGIEVAPDFTHEFRLLFPTSHLRIFADNSEKDVIWIPPASSGFAIEVDLIFGPRDNSTGWPGKDSMGTKLLAKGAFQNGRTIWLIHSIVPEGTFSNQYQLGVSFRDKMKILTAGFQASHRVFAPFRDPTGYRGYAEFAADSFTR